MRPVAALVAAYDSNVFAAAGRVDAQAVAIGEAVVRMANDPGIVQFAGGVFLRSRRFEESTDQNTTEYGALADVGWKPTVKDSFEGQFGAQRRFEPRTEIESPDSGPPSIYKDFDARLEYRHRFNRLEAGGSASLRRLQYVGATEQFRDRYTYRGEILAKYSLGSGLSFIANGYRGADDYDANGESAISSKSTGGLVGLGFGRPEIVNVALTVGAFRREGDGGSGDLSGVALRGSVDWYVTRLTTIRASVQREDQPTRLLGATGKVRTDGMIQIGHDYSSSLFLYARGRLVVDDFASVGTSGTTVSADLGLQLELSRNYSLQLQHDYVERSSEIVGESFNRHVISLAFVGHY